jgi:hypothetical protein
MSNAEGRETKEDEDMSAPEGPEITPTSPPNHSVNLQSPGNPPAPNNPPSSADPLSLRNPPPPIPSLASTVTESVPATLAALTPEQVQALEAQLRTLLPGLVAREVGSRCHQLAESLNVRISAIQQRILGPIEDRDTHMHQPPSSDENQNGSNPEDGDDENDDEEGPGRQAAKSRKGPIILTVSVVLP